MLEILLYTVSFVGPSAESRTTTIEVSDAQCRKGTMHYSFSIPQNSVGTSPGPILSFKTTKTLLVFFRINNFGSAIFERPSCDSLGNSKAGSLEEIHDFDLFGDDVRKEIRRTNVTTGFEMILEFWRSFFHGFFCFILLLRKEPLDALFMVLDIDNQPILASDPAHPFSPVNHENSDWNTEDQEKMQISIRFFVSNTSAKFPNSSHVRKMIWYPRSVIKSTVSPAEARAEASCVEISDDEPSWAELT